MSPYRYVDVAGPYDPFAAIRDVLAFEYRDLSPQQLEWVLMEAFAEAAPEDVENIWRSLKKAGRSVGRTLSQAAPGILQGAVQGASAGTAFGPYGTLIGALGGAALGGATSVQAQRQQRPTPTPTPGRVTPAVVPPQAPGRVTPAVVPVQRPPGAASAATVPSAAQLLAALFQPQTLQALMAGAMGQAGASQVNVAGRPVPIAAFFNLLSTLAGRAAEEYNALGISDSRAVPRYLMDAEGEYLVDPANPDERAAVLLGLLELAAQEAANEEDDYDDYDDYDDELFDEDDEDDDLAAEFTVVADIEAMANDYAWEAEDDFDDWER
ncbi:MAG: hypothetical protein MI924_18140 [Chloroflexales bacterium]|nr:hypothetical protein [Chloroflexales bacterium]